MAQLIKLLVIFLYFLSIAISAKNSITYQLNGGRLGDNISTLLKTIYLAQANDLHVLYKPFDYSDQFKLHEILPLYSKEESFDHIIKINSKEDILKNLDKNNCLFIAHFYTKLDKSTYHLKQVNPHFAALIQQLFTPHETITIPEIAEHAVALHIRTGGGFDAPLLSKPWHPIDEKEITYITRSKKADFADVQWPTKFPPLQYYFDQLIKLRSMIARDKKLTIYLFTDDKNPKNIVDQFKERLNDESIEFIFRDHDNAHNKNVVEDLIIMSKCKYLIRSGSLFAIAAQLIGDHTIIFAPLHAHWANDHLIIDKVEIIQKA